MPEAWITLECPACQQTHEEAPSELPTPETERTCDGCGETRPLSEFAQTKRDLEIIKEFH